jgi:predicted nucleotidyltransferase
MISQSTIQEAVDILRKAAHPVKIMLFGSYARDNPSGHSDLDILVIERDLRTRRKEMVRLRRLLRPLRIPVDIVVVSEKVFNEWSDTPGNIFYEAASEGRVMYEAS